LIAAPKRQRHGNVVDRCSIFDQTPLAELLAND